jgi:hypothetical protein
MAHTSAAGKAQGGIRDFGELIAATTTCAIHLETRDTYTPQSPGFLRWLDGYRADPDDRKSWWHPFHGQIADAVARGVVVRRARIVSEPITPFIRYEYDVTYQNVAAGEQVRWLPRRQASVLCLPGNDFWVFDDRLVRFHHFAGDGSSTEKEFRDEPHVIKLCTTAFEAVWEHAIDHADYRPV